MSIKKIVGMCEKESRVFVYPHPTDPRVMFEVVPHRGRFYLPGVACEEARGRQLVMACDLKTRRGLLADVAGKLGDFEGVFEGVVPYMREQLDLPARFTVDLKGVGDFVVERLTFNAMAWVIGSRMYATDGVKAMSVAVERGCEDEVGVPAVLVTVGGKWSYHGEGWWSQGDVWYHQEGHQYREVGKRLSSAGLDTLTVDGGEVVDPAWVKEVVRLKCSGFAEGLAPYQNSCMPILYLGRATGQGEGWTALGGVGPALEGAYALKHLQAILKRHKGCDVRVWEVELLGVRVLRVSAGGAEYVLCPLRKTVEQAEETW